MKKQLTLLAAMLLIQFCQMAQTLPVYVPANGLMGFWPFDGNANDISGNNNNGNPNAVSPTADRFNNSGMAYLFNGSSSYISTNMTSVLGKNPRAVSFWAKTTQTAAGMTAVSWGFEQNPAGARYECSFNAFVTGPSIDVSNAAITYSSPSAFNNSWHHFVYQFSGGTLNQVQIYQDGALLTQTVSNYNGNTILNTLSNWPVNFGRLPYVIPRYFNGSLDEIGIWNRTLTLCEIQQLYTGTVTPSFTITASATPTTLCAGSTLSLNASGANTYSWYPGNVSGSSATITANANQYTVVGTNSAGCTSSAAVSISLQATPSLTVVSSSSVLCNGGSATLTASGSVNNYTWFPQNFTGPNIVVNPTATTQYTVSSDNGNCTGSKIFTLTPPYLSVLQPLQVKVCSVQAMR